MRQPLERVRTGPGALGSDGVVGIGNEDPTGAGRPPLGMWDAVSIIVGIVVGAGIYQTAPLILKNIDNPYTALATWALGGLLSLIGALCYAELATTYPRDGGDIVYLSRAFGSWAGFLFGWVQLTVILTGSIGMMAFVFADYAVRFLDSLPESYRISLEGTTFDVDRKMLATFAFAGGSVLLLTITNLLGVVFGKTTQNILTVAKLLGLTAIIVAGFAYPFDHAWLEKSAPLEKLREWSFPFFTPSLGVALILILLTYGGWNDAAFVAAEVRDGKKNIARALIWGILIITVLYLLVNAAYINSLGYIGAQKSKQVAADVLEKPFGNNGVTFMCALVMISALGAVNGLIFTGARIYSTIGKDYPLMSWMSGWDRKHAAPVPALVTQGLISLILIFLVGTTWGQKLINNIITLQPITYLVQMLEPSPSRETLEGIVSFIQFKKVDWEGAGGFDTLVTCTAPIFWAFFLMTGISLFVLRERDSNLERPFKVPFYPELPIIFCLSCGYMLYSSMDYAISVRGWKGGLFLLGVVPLLIGLPLYRFSRAKSNSPDNPVSQRSL